MCLLLITQALLTWFQAPSTVPGTEEMLSKACCMSDRCQESCEALASFLVQEPPVVGAGEVAQWTEH